MSINEKKRNSTYYYFPPEITIKDKFHKNQNISRMRKPAIIYCSGVDDYILKQMKKSKYQGSIDLDSLRNHNIFNDNTIINNVKSNLKNEIITFEKNKNIINYVTSSMHYKDEGKNLLIDKTEIQYPLKYEKGQNILKNKKKLNKSNNNSINYNINPNTIETIEKNYIHNKKESRKINDYNYHTPINQERKYINENEKQKYHNRTLILSNLIDNYKENSNLMKKSRNNKFSKYSTDKINGSNSSIFSPTTHPDFSSANKSIHNTQKIKKINMMNSTNIKNDNNRQSCTFIYNQDMNKSEYFLKKNENENDNINKGDINDKMEEKKIMNDFNDIKLISFYRKKLLSLFFYYMGNFYKMYLKKVFNDFILKLKKNISNNKRVFEKKEIVNRKEIRKKLISNDSYNVHGHNKQNINLIRDIKNKHYLIINNHNNNKINITYNKLYLGNDNIQIKKNCNINRNRKNIIKKNYILNSTQIINKKIDNEISNKDKKDSVSNKKYIKKSITKKIFKKFRQNDNNTIVEKNNLNENNLNEKNNQENRKMIKSFDKISIMNKSTNTINSVKNNILISNKTSSTIKNNNKIISHPFKKVILNSSNINNKSIQNNKLNTDFKSNNIKNKKNNELKIDEILEGKSLDEKLNMSIKYLRIENKRISSNVKNDKNNYKIEKTFMHTFLGKEINNISLEENYNNRNIESFKNNKNLENALLLINKIKEIIQINEKNKNIRYNFLFEIIQKKIKKVKKKNLEITKKYFDIMKRYKILDKDKISREIIKYPMDINSIKKDYYENNEENILSKKNGEISKKKFHKSFSMNILNSYIKEIKYQKSSKSISFFKTDINNNNISSKNVFKKTLSKKEINKIRILNKIKIHKYLEDYL